MESSQSSRREVFRLLAESRSETWPVYESTPLYDRSSLGALEEDVRTVAGVWFDHAAHESLAEFVCEFPLAYVNFGPHDRYGSHTIFDIEQLVRLFVLASAWGIDSETELVEFLRDRPAIQNRLNFESVPDQSTLWRTWNERFSKHFRETITRCGRIALIEAERAGVPTPRETPNSELDFSQEENRDEEPEPSDREILSRGSELVEQVRRLIGPAFSLDRGEGCEIPENAFWELQTYLGTQSNLAANEGARSFLIDSSRERTPLGHAHRSHIRDLSVDRIREMYREAIDTLFERVTEEKIGYRDGMIAIDITEDDPFTGDRTSHEEEIIGTKEKSEEYAYQWATVQLVGYETPLVLDARPVRKGKTRLEIVEDLLESAEELVSVRKVVMDREFDGQGTLEMLDQRGITYVVPKRMHTSERAQAKRLFKRGEDRHVTDRKLHLGQNEWHETTLLYKKKEDSEHDDWQQYSVFMTNGSASMAVMNYARRWEIETGYRTIKRFMAATTSKNFVLRFFYFAFACLLYSIWRVIDFLLQLALTGEYERSPMITAQNTLTLLKKKTGIG